MRFNGLDRIDLAVTIEEVYKNALEIQTGNLGQACQLMLICAAWQSRAGQWEHALKTIGQVHDLATSACLSSEICWTCWGASAVYFQQGNYDLASEFLEELQQVLTQQNEWMLADFTDVIKQSLQCQPILNIIRQPEALPNFLLDDIIFSTFTCLQQWGFLFTKSNYPNRHWWNYSQIVNLFPWRKKDLTKAMYSERQSTRNLLYMQKSIQQIEPQDQLEAQMRELHQPAEQDSTPTPSTNRQTTDIINNYSARKVSSIPMIVQMLGSFSIVIQEVPLKLSSSRGLSVLKYLLLNHKQATPREELMDVFWPDTEPESARNSLNRAIHILREGLRSVTDIALVCFDDGAYRFSSDLEIWLDVDEFGQCVKKGQRLEACNQLATAVAEYEIAVNLYRGDFLIETPYEEWTVFERERLRVAYLDTLDHLSQIYFNQERISACIGVCQLILDRDACREDIHCRLMRCYSHLGQSSLALRQFQICIEALHSELDVKPAPETTQLYEKIHQHLKI